MGESGTGAGNQEFSKKKKDSGVVKEAGDILRLVKHTRQILESNNYLQDR